MKATTLLPCVIAMTALTFPVQADDAERYSKTHTACMDTASSTADMLECIATEYTAQDDRLNAAYRLQRRDLSDERKRQLRDVQSAWITYRDANCAFYDDPDGGTLARLSANQCMLDMTAQRATELERLGVP